MKKTAAIILALVLSFSMLSVFAASATKAEIDTAIDSFENSTGTTDVQLEEATGKRYVDVTLPFAGGADLEGWKISSKSGTDIDTVKFDTTASGFTGDTGLAGQTTIRVYWKPYTGTSTTERKLQANIYFKNGSDRSKRLTVEKTYSPESVAGMLRLAVDGDEFDAGQGQIVRMDEAGKVTVTFAESDVDLSLETSKIGRNVKFNTTYTTVVPAELDEAYPWNAPEYFEIKGATGAISNWKITIDEQTEGAFVYGYANGKLYNLPAGSWGFNSADESIVITGTGAIPALVLSGTDLKVTGTGAGTSSTPGTPGTSNPTTGRSGAVDAAVVFAVSALAAAGAVAFRKISR